MTQHRKRRDRQSFVWTAQRVAQLHQAYANYRSCRQVDAAQLIAEQLKWPVYAVQTELALLYPPTLAPALSIVAPDALLADQPTAEPGPFLWDVKIEQVARQRWSLRYRYGEWPWGMGQVVAYQGRLYRVRRVGCSSLVVALAREVQR